MSALVLPNSAMRETRGRVIDANSVAWIPIFCANCGKGGGLVVEPDAGHAWAFYLCDPCGEKWAPLADLMLVPDEMFWARVKAEQIEKYGRELTAPEIVELLKDGDSLLSKLARDRPR